MSSGGQSGSELLTVEVYGTLTDETVQKVADATLRLLDAVSDNLYGEGAIKWQVGPWRFICDGCDLQRPTAELPKGWVRGPGGMEYCPSCVIGGER